MPRYMVANAYTRTAVPGPVAPSGVPEPVDGDSVWVDTRSGGNADLQADCVSVDGASPSANEIIDALTYAHYDAADAPEWTTNYDGSGTRAFRYPWDVGDNYLSAYIYLDGAARSSSSLYWQHKRWMGRTSTGGGIGSIGVFNNDVGRKWMIFKRNASQTSWSRFAMTQTSGYGRMLFDNYIINGGPSTWPDLAGDYTVCAYFFFGSHTHEYENGVQNPGGGVNVVGASQWDPDDHENEEVTITCYAEPESSANAGDGRFCAWINDQQIFEYGSQPIGPYGFLDLELGGPTWNNCPYQQTSYLWDVVIWEPQSPPAIAETV